MVNRGWGATFGVFAVATVMMLSVGCESCGWGEGTTPVAHLLEATGTVQRDFAQHTGQWVKTKQGDQFETGDGLQTGSDGVARVKLARGGRLKLGNDSFVRFLAKAPTSDHQSVQVDLGDVEVQSGEVPVNVQTPSSKVQVAKQSSLNVEFGDEGTARFEVMVGEALYFPRNQDPSNEAAQNEGEVLRPGKAIFVNKNSGRIEKRVASTKMLKRSEGSSEELSTDTGTPVPISGEILEEGTRIHVKGLNAEVQEPGGDSWRSLAAGVAVLHSGAKVRVGAGSSIDIQRGDGQATLIGAAEASLGGSGGAILRLSRGQATAESGGSKLSLAVPGGTIILRPNARSAVLIGSKGTTNVRSIRGRVEVHGGPEPEILESGETTTLAAAGAGSSQDDEPTSRAALNLKAGSSAIIHDAWAPTTVGIRFGDTCPTGGSVDISRGREEEVDRTVDGDGAVILSLRAGAYLYQLYCTEGGQRRAQSAASGRIRIIRDPGTTPMGIPGHNTVDADGRNYTIRYETNPPGVTFQWSRAPTASSYQFHLRSSARTITRNVTSPRYTIRSGILGSGNYSFHFTTTQGHRSPQTKISLRVDAATVVASIRSPQNNSVSPGSRVKVSGMARPGSSVTVSGTSVPFESANRFSGEVSAPTDVSAIAIRIAHPTTGVHYFLRHMTSRGQ